MRSYHYLRVDVFTDRPFGGNPLVVFPDSEGLSDAEMRAIAREMNLSEVTFCGPAQDADAAFGLRIFTIDRELPMAGHPVVGTVAALCEAELLEWEPPGGEVAVELGVGVLPVEVRGGAEGIQEVLMTQRLPQFGAPFADRELIARALGLDVSDLHPDLPAQVVDTGVPWFLMPLTSLRPVAAIDVDRTACAELAEAVGTDALYAITQDVEDPQCAVHGRHVWFGRVTPGEDPITGSAVGCAASYLVQHEVVLAAPVGEVLVEQGLEIGRPGRARALVECSGGAIARVQVGGSVCFLGEGELRLP